MKILHLNGDDDLLYQLVARLVMNSGVIAANNNYPFKTDASYRWLVACDENGCAVAFMPLAFKRKSVTINNYYAPDEVLLAELLQCAVSQYAERCVMVAVVQMCHLETFRRAGFSVTVQWTKYAKLIYSAHNDQ